MPEGLPPSNAAHMFRLVCNESQAQAIVDAVVELFDMNDAAAATFELEPNTRDWSTSDWLVEVYLANPSDEEFIVNLIDQAAGPNAAKSVTFGLVAEQEWLANAAAGLEPVQAGRFIVHTSRDRKSVSANANCTPIEIDAALAFGTGHHGTTHGCLLMLDWILKRRRPSNILDIGTGTGVLAIAAARILRAPVACGDNDPISVATASENAKINKVAPWVRPVLANGLEHPALRNKAPFDLIFANILSKPLRALAPSIARASTLQTEIILSGLLARDVAGVVSTYGTQDFSLVRRIDIEGWATLLMRNGGSASRRLIEPPFDN